MKIDDVELKIASYGPMIGQRGLYITFSDEEPDGDEGAIDDPRSSQVYNEFRTILEKKELSQYYTKAIGRDQTVFFYFQGGEIEKTENAERFNKLYTAISKDAIDHQKDEIGMQGNNVKNPGQLRPPFMVFIGVPRIFTATRDFYQHFNVVVGIIDKTKDLDTYSETALREMMNHQFSTLVVKATIPEDLDEFKGLATRKLAVIDYSNSLNLYKCCLENNYRYYPQINTQVKSELLI